MKEYKVLNQKDGLYSGKFNPDKFEKLLNKYAVDGWRVVATSPVSVPSFGGNRQEILVILERDCVEITKKEEIKKEPIEDVNNLEFFEKTNNNRKI